MAILKLLASIVVVYGLVVLGIYFLQSSLIYLPDKTAIEPAAAAASDFRVIKLAPEPGLTIRSWYKPAVADQPTILYLHGNGGHVGYRIPLVREYVNQGLGVFLLSYRGYGGNPGKPSEQGLYRDAAAAYQYLLKTGVKANCILVYGESLGSAVAVQLVSSLPKAEQPHALVLQSPITTLREVASYHYSFLPVRWFLRERYDSLTRIKTISLPLLVIHGNHDRIVPKHFGERLYQHANPPKQFYQLNEQGHNNFSVNEINHAVLAFIANDPTFCK